MNNTLIRRVTSQLLAGTASALRFLLQPYEETLRPLTTLDELNYWALNWTLYKQPQVSIDPLIFKQQLLSQIAERLIAQATTRSGKPQELLTPWDLQSSRVFPMTIIGYSSSLNLSISEEMARGILLTGPPMIMLGITIDGEFIPYQEQELSSNRPFYPYWTNVNGQEYNITDDFLSGVQLVSDLSGIPFSKLVGTIYTRNSDGTITPYLPTLV